MSGLRLKVTEAVLDEALKEFDRKVAYYRGKGGVTANERKLLKAVLDVAFKAALR